MTTRKTFRPDNFLPRTISANIIFKALDDHLASNWIGELKHLATVLESTYSRDGVLGLFSGPIQLSVNTIECLLTPLDKDALLGGSIDEKLAVVCGFESSFIHIEALKWNYKDISASVEERKKGNEKFKQQQWMEALRHYNSAIVSAPTGSLLQALAIGNRSAAFSELKLQSDSARDCALALRLGFPLEKQEKIRERLTKCLKNMHVTPDSALGSKILKMVEHNEPNTIYKVIDEFCDGHEHEFVPEDFRSIAGKEAVRLASVVEPIGITDQYGFTFLKQDVTSPGLIFFMHSLKFIPSPVHKKVRCHNCSNELLRAVPCPQCAEVRFCSESCRDIAMKFYHKTECILIQSFFDSGFGILGFALLRYAALAKAGYFKVLDMDNWLLMLKLDDPLMLKVNIFASLLVFYLIECLRSIHFFEDFTIPTAPPSCLPGYTATEYKLMKLLLGHAYEVICTLFPVFEKDELVAVYTSSFTMNSLLKAEKVEANCRMTLMQPGVFTVTSTRNLRKGEAVVVNYLPRLPKC